MVCLTVSLRAKTTYMSISPIYYSAVLILWFGSYPYHSSVTQQPHIMIMKCGLAQPHIFATSSYYDHEMWFGLFKYSLMSSYSPEAHVNEPTLVKHA